jgi:alpha-aminoadipate carrier protein LysW
MANTRCPNCDAAITIDGPREIDIVICPECGVELEVINTDPFEVDFTAEWQDD